MDTTKNTLVQLGDSKTTYKKPEDLNKKSNITTGSSGSISDWNTIETTTYTLIKPHGQDNSRTSVYNNANSNVSKTSYVIRAIQDIISLFKK